MCGASPASGTRAESACRCDHAPALNVVCNGAAMKLRLMEQACGGGGCCTTVRGGGGVKVLGRLCV